MRLLSLFTALVASLVFTSAAHAGRRKAPEPPPPCPVAAPATPTPPTAGPPALPERAGVVHRGDMQLTLIGPPVAVGQPAPVAGVRTVDLEHITPDLADGVVRVVMTVPSLDTDTCSVQTRTFNADASDLGEGVEIVLVSRDLPFAQKRFCVSAGIDRVLTLSDYEAGDWGKAWGMYIKETGLLARSVAVVDGEGVIRYLQIVEDLPDEPDYAAALSAVTALSGGPDAAPE